MSTYLDQGIKELIHSQPQIATILEEFSIGCLQCGVGTCRLRDILEIHALTPTDQAELLKRLSSVLAPGELTIEVPRSQNAAPCKQASPPIRLLMNEHEVIKRVLAQTPFLIERLRADFNAHRGLVISCVGFIRNYADRLHHAKEEDILFAGFARDLEIIRVMHQDHEMARGYVQDMVAAEQQGSPEIVIRCLQEYSALLREHIRKEDEILYPWIDRQLTDADVGRMFSAFRRIDDERVELVKQYLVFASELEKFFSQGEHE